MTASKSGTVTGGIADDTISVTGTAASQKVATFTLTGGLGKDTFSVAESTAGSVKVTITDFEAGVDTISGGTLATVSNGATELKVAGVEAALEKVLGLAIDDSSLIKAYGLDLDATSGLETVVTYAGKSYALFHANGTANVDVVIELAGVNTASLTEVTWAAA